MATVVNRSQQVVTAGLRPRSAYSRIMVVHVEAAGGGGWGFGYGPTFGQQARLLNVSAVVQIAPGGALETSALTIHRGVSIPQTRQDVQAWEHVIDFGTFPAGTGLYVRGGFRQYSWDMDKLYKGEVNRFGVVFYNLSTNIGDAYVFFRISEG